MNVLAATGKDCKKQGLTVGKRTDSPLAPVQKNTAQTAALLTLRRLKVS